MHPATSIEESWARPSRKPSPSVLWPTRSPSSTTTQLTASSLSAAPLRRSIRAATAALWGMVTDRPANRSARNPSRARAASPASTSRATKAQSRPVALKAALSRAGDRECRTGLPITAAIRVVPLIGIRRFWSASATTQILLDADPPCPLEFVTGDGEGVGPGYVALVGTHIVEPVAVSRCQGGFERGSSWRGDWCRR